MLSNIWNVICIPPKRKFARRLPVEVCNKDNDRNDEDISEDVSSEEDEGEDKNDNYVVPERKKEYTSGKRRGEDEPTRRDSSTPEGKLNVNLQ